MTMRSRIIDLTALTAPAGEDVLGIYDDPSGTPAPKKITLEDLFGGMAFTNANTGIAFTGYSLTGSDATSYIDLAGTWNTTGTPTGIKLDITDTASNAASLLMDLQVGSTSLFNVDKTGSVTTAVVEHSLGNYTFDSDATVGAGQDNYVLTYDNGTGKIGLEAAPTTEVSNDTTPVLGGNLDVGGNSIVSTSAGNITIEPDTTGVINLTGSVQHSASDTLGLYGATPVAQQTTTGTTTGFTAGVGTSANDDSTFTGNSGTAAYTVGDIVLALKNVGILAAS